MHKRKHDFHLIAWGLLLVLNQALLPSKARLLAQMLQRTAAWCPNPDKVFISPTGQLMDSEAIPSAGPQEDSATPAAQASGQHSQA